MAKTTVEVSVNKVLHEYEDVLLSAEPTKEDASDVGAFVSIEICGNCDARKACASKWAFRTTRILAFSGNHAGENDKCDIVRLKLTP